jgi:hypothetical protein
VPLFTFYFFKGKMRLPVCGWNHWPNDYGELKAKLEEVALQIFEENKMTSAVIVLDRHMPGKFHWGSAGYKRTHVRHRRSFEAYFKTRYSPTTGKVDVEQASFGLSLSFLTTDFLELEKGKKYKPTPIIPKAHQGLLDQDFRRFQGERSGLQGADYSSSPRLVYGVEEDYLHVLQHYQLRVPRGYMEGGERISEQVKSG